LGLAVDSGRFRAIFRHDSRPAKRERNPLNKRRNGLAVCGVFVALLAAGCGSGSTSGNPAAAGGSTATAAPSPTNTQPAWVKSLGPGVTVIDSGSATAGDGSPAGTFLTEVKDLQSGHFVQMCSAIEPSQQAGCKSEMGSVSAAVLKSEMPVFKNIVIPYTAVDGDKALIGSTGSVCAANVTPSKCSTNTDPAAIFDSGKSFASLWKESVNSGTSNSDAYALNPLIKINGVWYGYSLSF
jgi:hypothetical protein